MRSFNAFSHMQVSRIWRGIHIVSEHSVMLEVAEDLTISSDTGSLIVSGDSFVNFRQKGTSIQLDDEISFVGGNLKIQ